MRAVSIGRLFLRLFLPMGATIESDPIPFKFKLTDIISGRWHKASEEKLGFAALLKVLHVALRYN